MGTKTTEIDSAGGVLLSAITGLDAEIRLAGGSFQHWHDLARPEGRAKLQEMARIAVDIERPETYRVIVKPSFEEMLRFANQAWVDSDFTEEHFPFAPYDFGEFNLELVHLGRIASTKDVIIHMREQHLIPVGHAILLGIAGTYPHLQRQFPLVALGSSWLDPDDNRLVPCLDRYGGNRRLGLDDSDDDWDDYCRFPALRIK